MRLLPLECSTARNRQGNHHTISSTRRHSILSLPTLPSPHALTDAHSPFGHPDLDLELAGNFVHRRGALVRQASHYGFDAKEDVAAYMSVWWWGGWGRGVKNGGMTGRVEDERGMAGWRPRRIGRRRPERQAAGVPGLPVWGEGAFLGVACITLFYYIFWVGRLWLSVL